MTLQRKFVESLKFVFVCKIFRENISKKSTICYPGKDASQSNLIRLVQRRSWLEKVWAPEFHTCKLISPSGISFRGWQYRKFHSGGNEREILFAVDGFFHVRQTGCFKVLTRFCISKSLFSILSLNKTWILMIFQTRSSKSPKLLFYWKPMPENSTLFILAHKCTTATSFQ